MWIGTPAGGWIAGAAALRCGTVSLDREAALDDDEGSSGCCSPGGPTRRACCPSWR
jgi:hypothetical protein